MGLKLSCISRGSLSRQASLTAAPVRVITVDGSLKEFPASPLAAVTNALGLAQATRRRLRRPSSCATPTRSTSTRARRRWPPATCFRPGQIYFVLPAAMLGRPLSSTEMAELAVRASAALAANSNKARRRCGRRHGRNGGKKQKVRVMPVRVDQENGGDDMFFQSEAQRAHARGVRVDDEPGEERREEGLGGAVPVEASAQYHSRRCRVKKQAVIFFFFFFLPLLREFETLQTRLALV
ncbi:hypothetical protein PR202_ga06761 [Eleusine coracana subsp. coracana]|uniref:Uncharacterized protein n=1 Tax=Eleusine coracana subsp. coracana TaxID=191504 RepID=A0AAV5BVP7_ELECO|nr:hypothetical protein PR202_ga06761 [Eleusine coracana subsp. coracana]